MKRYETVAISETAHHLLQDYEQSVLLLAAAKTPDATNTAFSVLTQRRGDICRYFRELELELGRSRTVELRF
jgi:hypothetical protein